MSTEKETPTTTNEQPPAGLPPVQPPSGRLIVQLFVVPGLIILGVVLVLLGLNYIRQREREPAFFIEQLESDNADIRWRGAADLAQVLKREEPATLRWKADPAFALDLTKALAKAFKDLKDEERRIGEQIAASTDKDKELLWRKLRPQRDYVSFLVSALGEFHVPVGVPVMCDILLYKDTPDLKGNTLQRRKAMWALMNLGENVKGFAKVPQEHRALVLTELAKESQEQTARGDWARTGLYYLDKSKLSSEPTGITKVDEVLVETAKADDRFMRELTAMAFNFWDGPLARRTLLALADDAGRGSVVRVEDDD